MSLLFRAAVLGGIVYLIKRSMSGNSMQRRSLRSGSERAFPSRELQTGSNIWSTSESKSPANVSPIS